MQETTKEHQREVLLFRERATKERKGQRKGVHGEYGLMRSFEGKNGLRNALAINEAVAKLGGKGWT